MKNELQDIMDRPKRYANIDGTGELSMGVMLLGFALLSYLQAGLSEGSIWRNGWQSMVLMYLILIPALALGYWGGKAIKKHITEPRTGYVAYSRGGKSWWTGVVFIFIVAAVIAAGFAGLLLFASKHDSIDLPRIFILATWVPGYAYWIIRTGRQHPWKWLVLLFMAAGLVAIDIKVPGNFVELFRPVALFVGLTWLASGAATLALYIRRTQPPVTEAE